MSTVNGRSSILITPDMINSINVDTNGGTSYSVYSDSNGGAIVSATFSNLNGCPANEGIFVELKDIIPWTKLYCSFFSGGGGSCWGWNGDNGFGAGINVTGNLKTYSEANGDYTKNEFNVWNLPQFRKYFSACDNNTDNYLHNTYLINGWTGFDMFCRRNSMGQLAGPVHGRTCVPSTINHGSIIIQNMRITI